jgi:hypothetical protein
MLFSIMLQTMPLMRGTRIEKASPNLTIYCISCMAAALPWDLSARIYLLCQDSPLRVVAERCW